MKFDGLKNAPGSAHLHEEAKQAVISLIRSKIRRNVRDPNASTYIIAVRATPSARGQCTAPSVFRWMTMAEVDGAEEVLSDELDSVRDFLPYAEFIVEIHAINC